MDKRQATEFLGYLLRDKNIERTIYEDALKIAIESLKAQLSKENTTKDAISKTDTVEHLRRVLEATVPNTDYDEGYIDGIEFGISTVSTMPTIQPQSTAGQLNDSAQSTAQSTNLIDRQAALDALNVSAELLRRVLDDANVVGAVRVKYEWGLELIESHISVMKELPSAQPEIPPYVAEIEAEYKKWINVPYIRKPLAKALCEVWKKYDREETERRTE